MKYLVIISTLFVIGSLLGWIIELFFRRFISQKKWMNPGFLTGPYLPIYGFGVLLLYGVSNLSLGITNEILDVVIHVIVIGICMTIIELIAGLILLGVSKLNFGITVIGKEILWVSSALCFHLFGWQLDPYITSY